MSPAFGHHFVLVTSGLGSAHGGIGVVSKMIVGAMERYCRVSIWRHPVALPKALRISALVGQALLGQLKRPNFVFYEHVHLAAIHNLLPGLRQIPYGVF